MEKTVDVAVIGAGSAGLNALGQIRKQTQNFILINGGHYGTTCARVGCMPSKVVIQAAEDFYHRHALGKKGIHGGEALQVDIPEVMRHVRELRDGFVGRVMNGMTKLRENDKLLDGYAEFVEPTVLKVDNQHTVHAKKIIIATGTTPVMPKPWEAFSDRIMTTDAFFEQEDLPPTMAVLGLGVIGLELGQSLSRLGIQVTGVDMLDTIGGIQDPEVRDIAVELMRQEFPIWLGQAAELSEQEGKLLVKSGDNSVVVDKVLASLGRRPNIIGLGLEKLGITLDQRGLPPFNPNTMQIGDLPIFIAGDVNADRPILHEAADEGKIAGFNAVNPTQAFHRKPRFGVTFCDPNIVSVGQVWRDFEDRLDEIAIGEMRFNRQGRALILDKNMGILRVYAEKSDGKLLGAEMIIPRGEHLGHLLAWAIQQQMTVFELLKMPFYHPVIEEGLENALKNLKENVTVQPDGLLELVAC